MDALIDFLTPHPLNFFEFFRMSIKRRDCDEHDGQVESSNFPPFHHLSATQVQNAPQNGLNNDNKYYLIAIDRIKKILKKLKIIEKN